MSTPANKENLSWGDAKTSPTSDKYSKKLNVFYPCSLWVRTEAILSSISCSHYGFLRKLIKNMLFRAPITEQFIFHQHYNTSAVFYKS